MLSVAALLVPAGGIAYLGAVSYRDERGAVSAQNARERDAALALVARIDAAIAAALDAADGAVEAGAASHAPVGAELGRYWFWIDAEQGLRLPRAAPPPELGGALERVACPSGLPIDACFRELEQRQGHLARLQDALRAEAARSWGRRGGCTSPSSGSTTRARRRCSVWRACSAARGITRARATRSRSWRAGSPIG